MNNQSGECWDGSQRSETSCNLDTDPTSSQKDDICNSLALLFALCIERVLPQNPSHDIWKLIHNIGGVCSLLGVIQGLHFEQQAMVLQRIAPRNITTEARPTHNNPTSVLCCIPVHAQSAKALSSDTNEGQFTIWPRTDKKIVRALGSHPKAVPRRIKIELFVVTCIQV